MLTLAPSPQPTPAGSALALPRNAAAIWRRLRNAPTTRALAHTLVFLGKAVVVDTWSVCAYGSVCVCELPQNRGT